MSAFVWFRMPDDTAYYELKQTHGTPKSFSSVLQLGTEQGFVFAPFEPNSEQPIVVIQAQEVVKHSFDTTLLASCHFNDTALSQHKQNYVSAFRRFHTALTQQHCKKMVLSRCEWHSATLTINEQKHLFLKACKCYPHLFIALINTPQTGTWLMATPETLLQQTTEGWKTMALAGTKKAKDFENVTLTGDTLWGEKEKEEQQWVVSYIEECLKQQNIGYTLTPAYTSHAAHLVHLRSDFSFSVANKKQVLSVLNALHPTPAVCGLPKEKALCFIKENEGYNRKYYSGFAGLWQVEGFLTHLFVTLRCMEITPNAVCFYAGGGLLASSNADSEWQETQNKMQTMKELFV